MTSALPKLAPIPAIAPTIGDYKFSALDYDFNGWLKCDGRTLRISDYPALFNVIGNSFGYGGEDVTTFNLPNCSGRVPGAIGYSTGPNNHSLGDVVGEEQHQLTVNEMPSHSHTLSNVPYGVQTINATTGGLTAADETVRNVTTQDAGGNVPHNIMQPTIFLGNIFIFSGFPAAHPTPVVYYD